jgi:glycosyltransferase involved in cell wall biosynthesis
MINKFINTKTRGFRTSNKVSTAKHENKLLISIITIVFNGEKYFERSILSVINQTYDNIEYIIIDGGSTDGTIDIIKKYQEFISYWISEPDKGIYDAMNKGIGVCRGDYIYFLNSDDYLVDSQVLIKVVEFIRANQADILYGNIYLDKKSGKKLVIVKIGSDYELFTRTVCHQAILASKDAFKTVEKFNTAYSICADREWLLRAIKKHKIKFSYIDLEICTRNPGGISSQKKVRNRLESIKMNFIYFGSKFPIYFSKQILNKINRIIKPL